MGARASKAAIDSASTAGARVSKRVEAPLMDTQTVKSAQAVSDASTAMKPVASSRALDEFNRKDETLVESMKKAMALPAGAIEFREHLLSSTSDDEHTRAMVKKAQQELESLKASFEQRSVSELPGGGRVKLEEFKAILGVIQTSRGQNEVIDSLAARFAVDPRALHNVARFYSIPKVKTAQVGEMLGLVAEYQ